MLKNANLYELAEFAKSLKIRDEKIGDMIGGGIANRYCEDVLWPRMKDQYILSTVEEIEKRLSIAELPKE